jgi:deoxyribonuclease-4
VGITRVCEAIDEIHERLGDSAIRIAIEGTAGQGNGLGYRFEHLRDLISGCRRADRVFVCLDTCHLFAAGYDLRDDEAYDQTMASFSRLVGLDKLRVLHLNDSKRELGSRVDRHEHIGQGRLGLRPFELILNDPRLARIPKVLETPKGETPKEDRRNLRVLRGLIRR